MATDSNNKGGSWFLQDDNLIDREVQVILSDPEAADELAKEVANEVVGYLEGNPRIKWEVVHAAFDNRDFRRMIIKILAAEMGQ